jgi:ribosomal protein S13
MPRNRPSSIEQLPADILQKLQALLRDPRVNQLDATRRINGIVAEQGHDERVSKSAVNRYAVRMNEVGERMRQSRQVSEMWIAKLGTEPEGKMGRLLNEMLRTLAFELTEKVMASELSEETLPGVIEQIKNLSLTSMRLEKSLSESIKTEKEIRKAFAEEVAAETEVVAKNAGLSAEAVQTIKNKILGIAEK